MELNQFHSPNCLCLLFCLILLLISHEKNCLQRPFKMSSFTFIIFYLLSLSSSFHRNVVITCCGAADPAGQAVGGDRGSGKQVQEAKGGRRGHGQVQIASYRENKDRRDIQRWALAFFIRNRADSEQPKWKQVFALSLNAMSQQLVALS